MCGICGYIDFTGNSQESTLVRMTRSLQHRGPDGDGHYYDKIRNGIVALGHRRLSIIDLSNAASQPMLYDNLVLTFNGEIYNYNEIREELVQKGHAFVSHSDTEVILHAWREWGSSCLKRFHGMYTMGIYDQSRRQMHLVRDRAGVKPLFWYYKDGLFLFASELKAFHQHNNFVKEINTDAVAAYMQYGYVPTPHCIFRYAQKLPPGHTLTLDLENGAIRLDKYWDVLDYYNRPKLSIPLEEAVTETERILEKAFQYRMVADVPVGVFLSGGYDSTCVTALLQKNSSTRINTYTIGVHDKGLNEAPFARATAAHLGTCHTEYYCTTKEALEIVPELPFYFDEPFADSSAIPTTLVSRLARKEVIVALSADAGDEVFGGYNKYDYVARVKNKLNKVPAPVRRGMAAVMKQVPAHRVPYFSRKPLFATRYKKIMHLLKDNSAKELLHNMSCLFFEEELDRLLLFRVNPLTTGFDEELSGNHYDDLSYLMAIDYKTYMLDDILQKVDRASMSVSLEGREPFLDQDVIEFAAQLPSSYKLHQGVKKYILRRIVHKYVPEKMMERPKMGFGIPIAAWLRKDLKHFVEEATDPRYLEQQGLFHAGEIGRLKEQFYRGKDELHNKIWYLLMFQMWYKRWI